MSIQLKSAAAQGADASTIAVSDRDRSIAIKSNLSFFKHLAFRVVPVVVFGISTAMIPAKQSINTHRMLHAHVKMSTSSYQVFSLPAPGTIYIDGSPASNGFEMQRLTEYTVTADEVPGATSYVWNVGNNATLEYGQGTNQIHIITGSNVGQNLSFAVQAVDGTGPGAGNNIVGTLVGL